MNLSGYQRVLVVLDGTVTAERGLWWARACARGPGSTFHLLMIQPPGRSVRDGLRVVAFVDQIEDATHAAARTYLDDVAVQLREDGLNVTTHVRIGHGPRVIRATLEEVHADLVVLCSGAEGLARELFRSVRVPVLVAGSRARRSA